MRTLKNHLPWWRLGLVLALTLSLSLSLGCSGDDDPLPGAGLPTSIEALSPITGPTSGGTLVRIHGNYFPQDAEVLFGANKAQQVVFISSSELVAVAPIGDGEGAVGVQVRDPSGASGVAVVNVEFTYFDPASAESPRPSSVDIKTRRGPTAGGTVTLVTGQGLVEGAQVFLGFQPAEVLDQSEGGLMIKTPATDEERSVAVVVQNPDGQFSRLSDGFAYYTLDEETPLPAIESVDPPLGSTQGGTAVVIAGQELPSAADLPLVLFGAQAITGVVDGQPGTLGAPTPAHPLGSVPVVITTADGLTALLDPGFTFADVVVTDEDRLRVLAVVPPTGLLAGGEALKIVGLGFEDGAVANINGVDLTTAFVDENTLTATAPGSEGLGAVDVIVTNPGGAAFTLKEGYTYVEEPVIDPPQDDRLLLLAAIPAGGPVEGDTTVRLRGVGFTEEATVSFGATVVETRFIDEFTLEVDSPRADAPEVVDISVALDDERTTTLEDAFTYFEPTGEENERLLLLAAIPDRGPTTGGTQVTLRGIGFTAGAQASFAGTDAETRFVDANTLIATAPPRNDAGLIDITVRLPDTRTSTLRGGFEYEQSDVVPVTVDLINPSFGPVGTSSLVLVAGSGFDPATTVIFGDQEAAQVDFLDEFTLMVLTPVVQALGEVDVTVTNSTGSSVTLERGFAFIDPLVLDLPVPAITSVTPNRGPTDGGTYVVIRGLNFAPGARVVLGGNEARGVQVINSTMITARTPAHGAGAVTVSVVNPGGRSDQVSPGYVYFETDDLTPPPTITSIQPNGGLITGGTPVVLEGTRLDGVVSVLVGGRPAPEVVLVDDTRLTFESPSTDTPGRADVTVTRDDGATATLPQAFNYRLPTPELTSLNPARGPEAGGTITLVEGRNLAVGVEVFIGGRTARVLERLDAEHLTVETPPGPTGPVDVTVQNPDGQSATLPGGFTYGVNQGEDPVITALEPDQGPSTGGTRLILRGENFDPAMAVRFGDAPATRVTVVSARLATVVTPAGAPGPVDVVVTGGNGGTATAADAFNYYAPEDAENPAPALSSLSPTRGSVFGGTRVSVAGANLLSGVRVFVGGRPAEEVQRVSASLLTATTPPGAEGLADVDVTNADGQSATLTRAFEYLEGIGGNDDPEISALSPNRGPEAGGTRVLLTGRNLRPGVQVLLAGRSATNVVLIDAQTLTFLTPAGARGPARVTVINTDGRSDSRVDGFTYLDPANLGPAPELTGVLPSSGPSTGGTEVLLTGDRFNDATRVFFGGRPAGIEGVLGATLLRTLTPPATPGVVDVEVVDDDGQTSRLTHAYTYTNQGNTPPPSLSRLVPDRGTEAGGTVVSIVGAGFSPRTEVFIANRVAEVSFISPSHLQVVTPAGTPGEVDVTAVNADGQTATLRGGYTYLVADPNAVSPQVLGVTPDTGRESGGEEVVISGRSFVATPVVIIGGRPATNVRFVSDGLLRANTPEGQPGPRDVVVTNPGGQSDILPAGFTYVARPSILDVTPAVGPTLGQTRVSISGQNFQPGAVVLFGQRAAASVDVLGPSVIEAVTPASAATTVDVTVINPDEQRAVAAGAFTFVPSPSVEQVRPPRGPAFGGSYIVVDGQSFRPGARVFFGDTESGEVTFVSETTLTVQLPVGTPGTVDVRVVNPAGQEDTLDDAFTYLSINELGDEPSLETIIPAQGPSTGGTIALAHGLNLQPGLMILVGRAPASRVFAYGNDRASFTTPPSVPSGFTGTVDVFAVSGDGQMARLDDGFRYTNPDDLGDGPELARVDPARGSSQGDEPVALNGTGFRPGALVLFGGRSARLVQVTSADVIRLRTPAGDPGAVDVSVTNIDGQSALIPDAFLYVPPPEISAVTPNRGPGTVETVVTITGAHFVDGLSVTLGGRDAVEVFVRDSGTIVARLPAANDLREGAEDLTVTNPDGQSATLEDAFTYIPPPEVTSVDPDEGPAAGGQRIQIHGVAFQQGLIVRVGDETVQNVEFITDRQIAVVTPPGAAGPAAISVLNPDGQRDVLEGAYTYIPAPRVDQVAPTSGTLEGGISMDVQGNFFQPGAEVFIGPNPAGDITFISAQVIRVTIPPGAAGPAAITVINPDGQRGTLAAGYTYIPPRPSPSIVGITPNFGDELGGANVTILGNFFQFGAEVFFGDTPAPEVEVISATYIRARVPGGAPGLVDVSVVNPDNETAILEDGFSYIARGQLPPIAVTRIVPDTGSAEGNNRVQVVGAGFRVGAQVTFDGVPCTDVRFVGPTMLTCTTGAHPAGLVPVSVTNPGGDFATIAEGFTYGFDLRLELDGWRLPPESSDMDGALVFDVDGDRDDDIFIFDNNAGHVELHINDGQGNFLMTDLGPFEPSCNNCCSRCLIKTATHGDVDADGDIDVIVGFERDRSLGLYQNQGDGTFERFRVCPDNNCNNTRWENPGALALVDVDADGNLDIVIADQDGPNSIARHRGPDVFEGNGRHWEFFTDALPPTNEKSASIAYGDVDNDGDIDLFIGNTTEEQNRLYLNQGDGTFTDGTATNFVVSGGNTRDVALVDIDGDFDLDALVFNDGQQDRVAINDGEGRFFEQTLGRMPDDNTSRTLDAHFVDFDQDGDFDFIVRRADGRRVRTFLNLGTGSGIFEDRSDFRLGTVWDHQPSDLALGDFDDDSDVDVITINNGQQNQLLINDGEGDFTDETYEYMPTRIDDSTAIDLGDIDGDGDLDMVVINYEGADFLYLNDGSGHFFDVSEERLPELADYKGEDVKFADINGDGDLDIFIGNFRRPDGQCCDGARNALLVNDGAGFFTDRTEDILSRADQETDGQALADFDNDGDLDYAFVNRDGCNPFGLFQNLGDGFQADSAIFRDITGVIERPNGCPYNLSDVVAQDFDGDGFIDLFFANPGGQNRLLLNNFPAELSFRDVTSTHIPGISDNSQGVTHGDFDGDRDIDIFLVNHNQQPRLHLNQGDGTFADVTATNLPPHDRNAKSSDYGDLDNDGDLDFFISNNDRHHNAVFLNVGNNIYESGDPYLPFDNDRSRGVRIGDLDGDGDLDVIVVGNGMNRIYWNKHF